ncbi:hypothetical protein D3C87_1281350 [compost metagenome]
MRSVANISVRFFCRVETVEELNDFPRQQRSKFAGDNGATCCKCPQLHRSFNDPHEVPESLASLSLRPVDHAFEGFIEHLVGHVGQHYFTEERHEWQGNERRCVEQCRGNFREGIPKRPSGFLVDRCGGDRNHACIVEDLVELALIEMRP